VKTGGRHLYKVQLNKSLLLHSHVANKPKISAFHVPNMAEGVFLLHSHTSNTFILKTTTSALHIQFTILNLCVPRILQILTMKTNKCTMYLILNCI